MKIFITGGAGYVGSALVPDLLKSGHHVTVIDLMIYGNDVLDNHPNLKIVQGDIRDIELLKKEIPGHDAVIHLACISNDPSFELNPDLGRSINLDPFKPLVEISEDSGVNRFIYASSSSVYGIKNEDNVNEDMDLEPLTDYSRFKADCEEILSNYGSESFTVCTLRPATVCGYARRQRLDVVVNIFANLAFHNREITIFGGDQLRPNIHIKDMISAYNKVLTAPKNLIANNIFNVGDENQTVSELAHTAKNVIGDDVKLIRSDTDDNRSYHISSEKIKDILDFKTNWTIKNAVEDLNQAFKRKLLTNCLDNEYYFNIKRMQNIKLV